MWALLLVFVAGSRRDASSLEAIESLRGQRHLVIEHGAVIAAARAI
jgi:hypothetical protein